MPAADWARGLAARRPALGDWRCPSVQPDAAAAPVDAGASPRSARSRCCVQGCVRVDDAYTNLVLPALLRQHGLTGRDAAFATELASGTIRWQGTYDAILAACIDRPLGKVEAKVLDVLRLGAHQLLAMRVPTHAAISTTVDLVRDRVGRRAPQASPTPCCARSPSTTSRPGSPRSPRPDRRRPPPSYSHPRWVVDELRAGARPRRRARRAARRRQRAAQGHPGRPARARHARRAAGGADPVLAVRRGAGGRRPGPGPGGRRGPGRGAGRGLPAGRARAGRGAGRRSRRALARPLRRTGRQGGPARRRSPPSAAPAWSPPSGSRTGPALVRAGAARRRRRRRRSSPPTAPRRRTRRQRSTGCWSTPRAPASVRSAVVPRRGGGGARRTCVELVLLQRRLLGRRLDLVRPGGSCSTRPARRCSPRPAASSTPCWTAATTSRSRTLGPLLPDVPDCRGPAAGHRPALAAPARHRRDVPGAAAQGLSGGVEARFARTSTAAHGLSVLGAARPS